MCLRGNSFFWRIWANNWKLKWPATSQTHFGLINIGSNSDTFIDMAIWNYQSSNKTPWISILFPVSINLYITINITYYVWRFNLSNSMSFHLGHLMHLNFEKILNIQKRFQKPSFISWKNHSKKIRGCEIQDISTSISIAIKYRPGQPNLDFWFLNPTIKHLQFYSNFQELTVPWMGHFLKVLVKSN